MIRNPYASDSDEIESSSDRQLNDMLDQVVSRRHPHQFTGGPNNLRNLSAGQFGVSGSAERVAGMNRTAARIHRSLVSDIDTRLKSAGTGNKRAEGVYVSPKLGMKANRAFLPFKQKEGSDVAEQPPTGAEWLPGSAQDKDTREWQPGSGMTNPMVQGPPRPEQHWDLFGSGDRYAKHKLNLFNE